jgi:GNAT superfamily N-acetyltransferase
MPQANVTISTATEGDIPLILSFVKQLAEYEKLSHKVVASEQRLRETLFGVRPFAEVVIGYINGEAAGFALFFHNYSTFLALPGIYLEDLFVQPKFRGYGVGKALLIHLAKLAVERNCGRLEWSVLDWNEPAIGFYKSLGAEPLDAWTVFRVTGDNLAKLAQHL